MAGLAGRLALAAVRRLEPERAHRLTLAALAAMPVRAAAPSDPRLAVEAFGLRFPNPLGLAAGFDKDAVAPDSLLRLGFGLVEVGTITPQPQPGNPRPRVFRLPEAGAVINRYGFNSAGHPAARARLLARRGRGGVVGVNLGANKDAGDRAADYVAGVEAFADCADYLAVNVSSPNTPGLRDLQAAAALDDLLARVLEARDRATERVRRRVPVLLKIAPDLDENGLDDTVRVARARNIDGMIVSNTTVDRPDGLGPAGRETGGLSGRPLFGPSTRTLARVFLRSERQFPLVGVGGVENAAGALAKVRAGATLVQLYTALVYAGPSLVRGIASGLLADLEGRGTTLAEEVGSDAALLAASG